MGKKKFKDLLNHLNTSIFTTISDASTHTRISQNAHHPPTPRPLQKKKKKTLNGCGCSFPLLEEAEYGGTTGKTKERVR